MFLSLLLASCLTTLPSDFNDTVNETAEVGMINNAKAGNIKSQWTTDGKFIREQNGKIVGYFGVDAVPGRLMR